MTRPMQCVSVPECAHALVKRFAEIGVCMKVASGGAKEGMRLQSARALACALTLVLVADTCAASTISLPSPPDQLASAGKIVGSSDGESLTPQYRQEEQQSAPPGATQFPYSADAFLRALQKLSAANSLFQAAAYNTPSHNGSQWWSVLPSDSPKLRTEAAMLASGLNMSADSFGGMFAELLAQVRL